MTKDRKVSLTLDEVYAASEVLGRVTPRQLRGMGLQPKEVADVARSHEVLVEVLVRSAKDDPRQMLLHLHPENPAEYVRNARAFFHSGKVAVSMTTLGKAFHALERLNPPGLDPWDPSKLLHWYQTAGASHYELLCAHFVLAIWNTGDTEDAIGRFPLFTALAGWDREHRAAFTEWARRPWFA